MNNEQTRARTLWMVQTAILSAIIILMSFTPLGYLRTGVIEITFIMIPVAVGAILMGPATGALLGAVFGITSFLQAVLGLSVFGVALLQINPFYTFLLTMVPRILMGWLVGLIFRALHKVDRTKILSFAIASLSGAVINTVLFVGGLFLLFGQTDYIRSFGPTVPTIIALLVSVNAALEAVISLIAGTAVTKALSRVVRKNG